MKYQPIIIRNDSEFCVYLPELNIKGVGGSISDAYAQFESNFHKEELQSAEFGLSALKSEPYPSLKRKNLRHELALFCTKVAVSAFTIILVVVLLLPNISAAIKHNIRESIPMELRDPRYWALQFPEQINARLDRLKPEEKEQIQKEWKSLILRIQSVAPQLNTCDSKHVLKK
jgi:hypothetical protein